MKFYFSSTHNKDWLWILEDELGMKNHIIRLLPTDDGSHICKFYGEIRKNCWKLTNYSVGVFSLARGIDTLLLEDLYSEDSEAFPYIKEYLRQQIENNA